MTQPKNTKDNAWNSPRWRSITDLTFILTASMRNGDDPAEASPLGVDTLDYNDEESTERIPMPHLYPSLELMPLPSTAAND
jgi:hypothetical protein